MAASPTPNAICNLRASLEITQQEAADSVHVTLRAWQMWEAGQRKMPAGIWELCVIKAGIHPLYKIIQSSASNLQALGQICEISATRLIKKFPIETPLRPG